jgi:hypothetical protein
LVTSSLQVAINRVSDLLTLLIATCNEEVTNACSTAIAACPVDEPELRLRAAIHAFRSWSLGHRPEFGLLWGTPIVGYAAPPQGPTVASSLRFGQVFGGLFGELLRAGRLRTVPAEDLDPQLRADLAQAGQRMGLALRPSEVYPFVQGFQRMLGIVSVEVFGHLRWAFEDAETFSCQQLDDLVTDLLTVTVGDGDQAGTGQLTPVPPMPQ